ncbi:alanyl-tRNA editing protein [Aestuariivita boseongensis]|uniref:alanyl-tRNA editing protein n=1 Tax=Aestuariivita boseongensis TaxID=1470562 RepID=UPI000680962B|nr:alanyl-tRNA editing protein [Aestuariivita boseongensis]
MTEPLYLQDAYLRKATGRVVAHTPEGGIVLDQSVFYPTSGGQPGDSGHITWDGGEMPVASAAKADGGAIALVPGAAHGLPPIGADVLQEIDWTRRFAHMRVHTALHLLSVVVPLPVTGGSISVGKGRLDFDMPDAEIDKDALAAQLNEIAARDLAVTEDWITDAELDAQPELVKTMSVAPPRGAGRVRLVRIGSGDDQVDLQPCGGTHVKSTAEIGVMRIGKTEKKGRQNRRIYLHVEG